MLLTILLYTLLGSVASLSLGVFLVLKQRLNSLLNLKLVSLAAGVLLATAFFDILPDAVQGTGKFVFTTVLFGLVFVFLLERTLIWHHHHHETKGIKPSVWLVTIGDSIHNFVDGIAISVSFLTDYRLGIMTALAVMMHEIPQEVGDFSVYLGSGMSKSGAIWLNLFSALAAFAGALIAYILFGSLNLNMSYMLGFTAGIFIYISCSDLIPELHAHTKEPKAWSHILPFFLGIGLVYISGILIDRLLG